MELEQPLVIESKLLSYCIGSIHLVGEKLKIKSEFSNILWGILL